MISLSNKAHSTAYASCIKAYVGPGEGIWGSSFGFGMVEKILAGGRKVSIKVLLPRTKGLACCGEEPDPECLQGRAIKNVPELFMCCSSRNKVISPVQIEDVCTLALPKDFFDGTVRYVSGMWGLFVITRCCIEGHITVGRETICPSVHLFGFEKGQAKCVWGEEYTSWTWYTARMRIREAVQV
jgi:hypothetical protein